MENSPARMGAGAEPDSAVATAVMVMLGLMVAFIASVWVFVVATAVLSAIGSNPVAQLVAISGTYGALGYVDYWLAARHRARASA